jgi:hypothetical protein
LGFGIIMLLLVCGVYRPSEWNAFWWCVQRARNRASESTDIPGPPINRTCRGCQLAESLGHHSGSVAAGRIASTVARDGNGRWLVCVVCWSSRFLGTHSFARISRRFPFGHLLSGRSYPAIFASNNRVRDKGIVILKNLAKGVEAVVAFERRDCLCLGDTQCVQHCNMRRGGGLGTDSSCQAACCCSAVPALHLPLGPPAPLVGRSL